MDKVQKKTVILSVIHHRQNPLESTSFEYCLTFVSERKILRLLMRLVSLPQLPHAHHILKINLQHSETPL
jgi:hypothetical protein